MDLSVEALPKNKIAFDWESKIPFYYLAFVPYFGIFILPIFIPFYIRKKYKLYRLSFRLLFSILVAGIVFRFFPCELSYPQKDIFKKLEEFTLIVAGKYNLIPSLHVCLTFIICSSLYKESTKMGKFFIIGILIILPLSTIFTHQHHVLDVIAGLFLGILAVKTIPFK